MSELIRREDAIEAIHNYWKKRFETLPTKESEHGEVYADIQQMDKILEHNKILCNFIEAIPSADRPQGKWLLSDLQSQVDNDNGNYAYVCTNCNHTDIHAKTQKVPYCWWCGARMKGADRKTENSSEKPNNCEDLQDWKDRMWAEAVKDEPQTEREGE